MNLIVVDDEPSLRKTVRLTLESMKHQVTEVGTGPAALSLLDREEFDLMFLDLRLGRESGIDLIPKFLMASRKLGIVMMTAYAGIDSAVAAIRSGAFDYIAKPFTPDQLRLIISRWSELHELRNEVQSLRQQVQASLPDVDLSTVEPSMKQVLDVAFRVAPTEANVLLRGESGTGKGVLARAIHQQSKRKDKPFVVVHCPSLSAELLESELFGHAKGAFTGAIETTDGRVYTAQGGTLFLDEIGDLPLALQPKLLRFLQEKTYERVGESKTRSGDVRLLAATNRPLEEDVTAGRFREDLFYRLNVIELTLPPLRERRQDIVQITNHLLEYFGHQVGKPLIKLSVQALEAIKQHTWPGNLRELRNAIERGVILTTDDEVGLAHLPQILGRTGKSTRLEIGGDITLEQLEAEHIRRVLAASPSLDHAAETLGIDASTLYRKRKKLGL